MVIFFERPVSKHQRHLFEQASQHFADTLLSPKVVDKLIVHIELVKDCEEGDLGYCTPVSTRERTPREFEIVVKRGKQEMMLKTLAHEFVHLKQFALKELSMTQSTVTKWKSRLYNDKKTDYWKSPWEREAHDMEDVLYESFMASWDDSKK